MLNVLLEAVCVHTENTAREDFSRERVLKLHCALHEVDDTLLEFWGPELWLLNFNRVNHVDTEVQVLRLVTHDVLNLLCRARELVLALEAEHNCKRAVEEDTFHNEREDAEVLEELLVILKRAGLEAISEDALVETKNHVVLVVDGLYFAIHVENL